MIGAIFNCALMDAVKARAAAGDSRAQQILASLLPRDAPPSVAKGERDYAIREIAAWLTQVLPESAPYRIASIVAAAGNLLDAGADLRGPLFEQLTEAERQRLRADVTDILRWAPVVRVHGSRRWPRLRHIQAIIGA